MVSVYKIAFHELEGGILSKWAQCLRHLLSVVGLAAAAL